MLRTSSSDPELQVAASPSPWRGRLVHWKDRSTWFDALGGWIEPYFRKGAFTRLSSLKEKDLCWDDSDWLDVVLAPKLRIEIDTAVDLLADELDRAILRAFHGCRVADAGVFHREGIRLNDPTVLEAEVRRIVAEEDDLAWRRPTIGREVAEWDARERDTGRLYVCADDQPQLDRIGHYMLYGSEWITALLGFSAHHTLRRRGVPTMIELDLPFNLATPNTRREFARKLLQEWVRVLVNAPTFVPKLDFTVILRADLPPEMIVGHYHPTALKCPFNRFATFETKQPVCPSCAPA
jgi:hypothetical protein